MNELLAVGVSHRTAPVALRERLAVTDSRAGGVLSELIAADDVHEAVVISTCNRTELYAVVGDPVEGETAVLGELARLAGIRPMELTDALYTFRNCDAARHLFRVTAGLESMIVGEAEIQGQVRRAYDLALESGMTGPLTNRLFRAALATGKRVRSETAIGEARVNVSTVAVDLAREAIGELAARHVVVLGTGDMGELTARALAHQGVHTVFVSNRRHDRAVELARRYGGSAVGFDRLPAELEAADIVLTSTASPHAIVGQEELAAVMAARPERPLLVIDTAVPRDVEPLCAQVPGVRLYDIDDLQDVVARNMSVRRAEARRAEAVVEEEIHVFAQWLGSLEVLPTIAALRARGDAIVQGVLAENAERWESPTERDRARIEAVARSVANRLLHEPTLRMKKSTGDEHAHVRMQLLRDLFGLEDDEAAAAPAPPPAEEPARTAEVRELPRRHSR